MRIVANDTVVTKRLVASIKELGHELRIDHWSAFIQIATSSWPQLILVDLIEAERSTMEQVYRLKSSIRSGVKVIIVGGEDEHSQTGVLLESDAGDEVIAAEILLVAGQEERQGEANFDAQLGVLIDQLHNIASQELAEEPDELGRANVLIDEFRAELYKIIDPEFPLEPEFLAGLKAMADQIKAAVPETISAMQEAFRHPVLAQTAIRAISKYLFGAATE